MRTSKLDKLVSEAKSNGWEVFAYGGGKISPDAPQSKLYKLIREASKEYKQVDYLIGARRRYASEGCWFAVIGTNKK